MENSGALPNYQYQGWAENQCDLSVYYCEPENAGIFGSSPVEEKGVQCAVLRLTLINEFH